MIVRSQLVEKKERISDLTDRKLGICVSKYTRDQIVYAVRGKRKMKNGTKVSMIAFTYNFS